MSANTYILFWKKNMVNKNKKKKKKKKKKGEENDSICRTMSHIAISTKLKIKVPYAKITYAFNP